MAQIEIQDDSFSSELARLDELMAIGDYLTTIQEKINGTAAYWSDEKSDSFRSEATAEVQKLNASYQDLHNEVTAMYEDLKAKWNKFYA